jgi:hypothetical protein
LQKKGGTYEKIRQHRDRPFNRYSPDDAYGWFAGKRAAVKKV